MRPEFDLAAMAAKKMILKCSKTGRLFFTAEEAQEHAEAFGAAYANFDEVSAETKVFVAAETGRVAYTEAEMARLKARDPSSITWEEKTVEYLIQLQKKKEQAGARKEKFFNSVDQKKLSNLVEVKQYTRVKAAKALHFTKAQGTIEAAEAYLAEHGDEPGMQTITDEFLDSVAAGAGDVAMEDANGDVVMDEGPDERKVGDPNPPEIKEKVNQDLCKQVMEMGFSELRAEKALIMTDNQGLEFAVNWLGDHGEDADIDLPLKKPPAPKPKMSPEEAAAKLKELQDNLRRKKAEEEKLSEKEKERMRVESTKMMLEANEKLKEEERKRAFAQIAREKEETEKHRAELKERLRLDYIDRFGKEPPPEAEATSVEAIKEKSSKDQVAFHLSQLKKKYKDTDPEGLKTCLSTLKIYVKNLMENPQDLKFKKLKVENKAFQTRIAPFEGAMEFLDVIGFENKGEFLEQRKSVPDGWLCGNALKFIDLILSQI